MAAGYAGLSVELTPERLAFLNARGDSLRDRLAAAFAVRDAPLLVTGLGSLVAIHTKPDVAQQAIELLLFDLLADGICTATRGLIALSVAIGDAEVELLCGAVERLLDLRQDILQTSVGR